MKNSLYRNLSVPQTTLQPLVPFPGLRPFKTVENLSATSTFPVLYVHREKNNFTLKALNAFVICLFSDVIEVDNYECQCHKMDTSIRIS